MNQVWKRYFEQAWLWFFPRRCVWCSGVTEPRVLLCPACELEAPPLLEECLLPGTKILLISVFDYHTPANRIMLNFKFRGAQSDAHSIGYAMGDAVRRTLERPDEWLFCCVPMTEQQLQERGYNQSALLAQAAARWVGADCDATLLCKCRETQTQHSLSAQERAQNMINAFALRNPDKRDKLLQKPIVLCDDIATTGSTLRACVQVLQEAGVTKIACLTYLRTQK